MTKKELEQMAEKSLKATEITHWSTGTSGFHEGFEACYRLLTTPRPMSEAPRDGTAVLLLPTTVSTICVCARHNVNDGEWHSWAGSWNGALFTEWLPVFTPLEEDANG